MWTAAAFIALLFTTCFAAPCALPPILDIVWLVDGTYSTIEAGAFAKQVDFIKNFSLSSSAESRHGFVVYGGEVWYDDLQPIIGDTFPISTDRDALAIALDSAQPVGGSAAHDKALQYAQEMFDRASNGAVRVVVLFALLPAFNGLGQSLQTETEAAISQLFAATGAQVYLATLGSQWTYDGVFGTYDGQQDDLQSDLFLCGLTAVPTQSPVAQPTQSPTYALPFPLDVFWLVQSSNSMENLFSNITSEISSFSARFEDDSNNQLGFLEFAEGVGLELPLTTDIPAFVQRTEQVSQRGPMYGTTNVMRAFARLQEGNLIPQRVGVHQLVILVMSTLPTNSLGVTTDELVMETELAVQAFKLANPGIVLVLLKIAFPPEYDTFLAQEVDYVYDLQLPIDLFVELQVLNLDLTFAPTKSPVPEPSAAPTLLPTDSPLPPSPTSSPTLPHPTASPFFAPTTATPTPIQPSNAPTIAPTSSPLQPTIAPTPCARNTNVDIVWLLQSSNGVSQEELNSAIAFIAQFIDSSSSSINTRHAFLQYSGASFVDETIPVIGPVQFPFQRVQSSQEFQTLISGLESISMSTNNAPSALEYARTQVLPTARANNVERVVVLFLFSDPSDLQGLQTEAMRASTESEIDLLRGEASVIAISLNESPTPDFPQQATVLHQLYMEDLPQLIQGFMCSSSNANCNLPAPLDLFWVVQSSTNMETMYSNIATDIGSFSKRFLTTTTNNTQLGYLEFAGGSQVNGTQLPLSSDIAQFIDAIEISASRGAMMGTTDLVAALDRIHFPARVDAHQIIVLVMAGLPSDENGVASDPQVSEAAVRQFKLDHPGVLVVVLRVSFPDYGLDFLAMEWDFVYDVDGEMNGSPLASVNFLCDLQLSFAPSRAPTRVPTKQPTMEVIIGPGESTSQPSSAFPTSQPSVQPSCHVNSNADYVFMLQNSNAVYQEDVDDAIRFIAAFMRQTDQHTARFGFVAFAGDVKAAGGEYSYTNIGRAYGLGELATADEFELAMQGYEPQGGRNNLQAAAEYVDEYIFTPSNLRVGVERIVVLITYSDPSDEYGVPTSAALQGADEAFRMLQLHHNASLYVLSVEDALDPDFLRERSTRTFNFNYEQMALLLPQFLCVTQQPTASPTISTLAPSTALVTAAPAFDAPSTVAPSAAPTRYVLNNDDINEWRRFRSLFPDQTFCPAYAVDICNACGEHNSTDRYVVCDFFPVTNVGRRQLGQIIELRISKIKMRNSRLVANLTTSPRFRALESIDLSTDSCLEDSNRIYLRNTEVCNDIPQCKIDSTVDECPPQQEDEEGFPWWLIVIILLLLLLCCCCCILLLLCCKRKQKEEKEERKQEDAFFKYNDLEDGNYDPLVVATTRKPSVSRKRSSLSSPKDGWEEHVDPDSGTKYYVNRRTHEFRWTHPDDTEGNNRSHSVFANMSHGNQNEDDKFLHATNPLFGVGTSAHYEPVPQRQEQQDRGMVSLNPGFEHGDLVGLDDEATYGSDVFLASQPQQQQRKSRLAMILPKKKSTEAPLQDPFADMQASMNPAFAHADLVEMDSLQDPVPPLDAAAAEKKSLFGFTWGNKSKYDTLQRQQQMDMFTANPALMEHVPIHSGRSRFADLSSSSEDEEDVMVLLEESNPLFEPGQRASFAEATAAASVEEPSVFEQQSFAATGAMPVRNTSNAFEEAAAPHRASILRTRSTSSSARPREGSSREVATHRIVETPATGVFHVHRKQDEDDEEELTVFQKEKLLRGGDMIAFDDNDGIPPQRKSSSKKDFKIVRDSKTALKRLSLIRKPNKPAGDDDDNERRRIEKEAILGGRVQEMRAKFEGLRKRESTVQRDKVKLAQREQLLNNVQGEVGAQGKVSQVVSKFAPKPASTPPKAMTTALHNDEEEVLWIEGEDEDTGNMYWMDADTGEFTYSRPQAGVFTSEHVLHSAGKPVVSRQLLSREEKKAYGVDEDDDDHIGRGEEEDEEEAERLHREHIRNRFQMPQ